MPNEYIIGILSTILGLVVVLCWKLAAANYRYFTNNAILSSQVNTMLKYNLDVDHQLKLALQDNQSKTPSAKIIDKKTADLIRLANNNTSTTEATAAAVQACRRLGEKIK